MPHDEVVPPESSEIRPSAVPLSTRRRRRRRKSTSGTRFRPFMKSVMLHALTYSLLYTVFWKCPWHPGSSQLCPIVNTVITEPLTPFYDKRIGPYAEPAFERIQIGYATYAEPVVARAASVAKSRYNLYAAPYVTKVEGAIMNQYDDKARPTVEKIVGMAAVVYNDKLVPLWKSSQPYIAQAQQRANLAAVHSKYVIRQQVGPVVEKMMTRGCELTKVSWAKIVKFYNEVIVVNALQLYFDHVEPAVLRVRDRIFSKVVGDNEDTGDWDDDEIDEEREDEDEEDEEDDIESVITSTITRTVSRTATASVTTAYPADAGKQTPEITPPAEPIDPDVAEHQFEIEKDIISWTSKFRTAGKNAVSTFSMDLDALFQSAEQSLSKSAEHNLLRAQNDMESIIDTADASQLPVITTILVARADAVRRQAIEAANAVLKDAESIRSSTLDIFKTVTDIGLQELGRKWAFMEGITWQDWKEYRTLKSMADDFAQVIIEIPIDDKVVQNFLSDFDEAVSNWIEVVEAKVAKLLEEAALKQVAEETVSEQLDESTQGVQSAVEKEISQPVNTEALLESSSSVLISVPVVPVSSATDSSAETLLTSSSSTVSSETSTTSASASFSYSHDEL
ncbi:hypothetical protein V1517DRAFT_317221 [Lipomyces orientalis]|uniref:Uncharacterized protein n=1 Tax=Lipomyces orientalis TaxID=1233043 RepID=A0ACC3TTK9_9ASCO